MRRALWLVLATAACQLALPIHEEVDASVPDADAAIETSDASDASVSSDASDASSNDASQNLVLNPSFELGDGGCGSFWGFSNSVIPPSEETSSIAYVGARSCEFCTTGPQSGVMQAIAETYDAGVSFNFGAYFTAVPPATLVNGRAILTLHETADDGGTSSEFFSVVNNTTDGGWQALAQTSGAAKNPVSSLMLGVEFTGNSDGGCILIDDAFVTVE